MRSRFVFPLVFLAVSASSHADAPPQMTPPATEKKPVTDEYHGVAVTEDYRWLEDGKSVAVREWSANESRYARAFLDALPDREGIESQLKAWFSKDTPSYRSLASRPERLFALKFQPPKQQRLLVTLRSADDLKSEQVLLDPNELEPKGQVAIDWYVPSPDGSLVAVCLSKHGSEDGTLHIYDARNGHALPDEIERVQYPTGGGSAAWRADGKRIFYTRYPAAGEHADADIHFYQQVWVHALGSPAVEDQYSIGKDFPRIAETKLHTSRDGRWLLASVANGDGGEFEHLVLDLTDSSGAAVWRKVARFEDKVKDAVFSVDGKSLFLRSVNETPRGKVLRLPLDGHAELKDATVVIPESDAVIETLAPTERFLFTEDLVGGPSQIRRFDLDGKGARKLPLSPSSGVAQICTREDKADSVLFLKTSYTEPMVWDEIDSTAAPEADAARATALADSSPVDLSDVESVRETAVSKDGTRVPMTILRRRGTKLDGSNPTLLYAYGGYSISLRPSFDFTRRLWFDRGGVYVVANLRGGGEYGEEWHLAGNLTHKQNVFDDFAACAEHLIRKGYTRPEKLAVEGGSNGGLLMGAFLTQHPDLARAVVSHVGIYDMLRVELDPNGAFNVTEFGTVKDPEQFKALHAYSPYHHVLDGVKYPAVLLLAGENDGRVNPAHSRKMTARLQAATGSQNPVLLRLSASSGHGMGTALSERIAQEADVYAFLFRELGMQPAPK